MSRLANEKRDVLWERVCRDPYDLSDLPGQSGLDFVRALSIVEDKNAFLMASFEELGDELPDRQTLHGKSLSKIFHRRGTVAKVRWAPAGAAADYTGFLHTGGLGLLRASLVSTTRDETFSPGIGLKLFRDDRPDGRVRPSVNLVASYRLEGMPLAEADFFAFPFRTTIPLPRQPQPRIRFDESLRFYQWRALVGIFEAAFAWTFEGDTRHHPHALPVDELARALPHDDDEQGITDDQVPALLQFVPTPEVRAACREQDASGHLRPVAWRFREVMAQLTPGMPLLDVEALDDVGAASGAPLGTLVLDSSFVASAFGDDHLFFRHPLPTHPTRIT